MENTEEKASLCALNKIFGFKPKLAQALISHLGGASPVFRLNSSEADSLLGPYSGFRGMIHPKAVDEAFKELERLKNMDIGFVGWSENNYPELLHECEDAPVGLYVRSLTPMEDLWKPMRRIAVVGTRDISPYGREWCVRTVTGLASSSEKPAVISGLALGTDFCAHKTALEYGLPTIAVMATGPETVYPFRHREFAERLYSTPGCALVTDYPPGTAPLPVHFLRRNRIIAGLSDSTILIESKIKGGGMMTSRLAFSYSRDVYALPGRSDDPRSQGCNILIKNKVAEIITSVDELLESLSLSRVRKSYGQAAEDLLNEAFGKNLPYGQVGRMLALIGIIRKERGITLEELSSESGIEYIEVSKLARLLETYGFIDIDILQRCTVNIGKFR